MMSWSILLDITSIIPLAALFQLLLATRVLSAPSEVALNLRLAKLARREDLYRPQRRPAECHHMPTVTVWSKARSRFTLKCGIRGSREDAVQWVLPSGVSIRRAANDFRNSNIRANRLELLRKGSLRLHSISVADSGSYVCIRRSTSPTALGESTSTEKCTITKLVVIGEKHGVNVFYQNRSLTLGTLSTLDCHTPGMLDAALLRRWTKESRSGLSMQFARRRLQLSSDGKYLSLRHVTWSDAGRYSCEVVNGSRRSIVHINVNVLDVQPEEPPQFTLRPRSWFQRVGQSMIFTCSVRARGLVQIRWKFCRAHVRPTVALLPPNTRRHLLDRVSIEPTNGEMREVTRRIVLDRVRLEDEGFYICIADNSVGLVKSYAFLKVT